MGEPAPDAPCTLPKGLPVPEKRKLFNTANLEIIRPTRQSVIGFIVAWATVIIMIAGFYAITR